MTRRRDLHQMDVPGPGDRLSDLANAFALT